MGPIGDARIVTVLIIAAVVADRGVCSFIAVHFLGFMLEKWIAEEAPATAASRLRGGAHDGGPFDYKIQRTFGCHGHALWIWKHVLLPRFREWRIVRIGHFTHISRFMEIRPSLMGDTLSVKWGGEVDTTPAGFQKQQQRHTRCRNPATTTTTTGGIPEILGIPEFNLEIRKFGIQNSLIKMEFLEFRIPYFGIPMIRNFNEFWIPNS
jgi:hypothetical protein